MPFVLFLLAVVSGAAIWYYRARAAAEMSSDLLDAASDVRQAAARFLYKRKYDIHPVEAMDDPRLAGAGIVYAVANLSGPVTAEQLRTMNLQFQSVFGAAKEETDDMVIFARWIVSQCRNEGEAVRRLSRKLFQLSGREALPDLERMIDTVLAAVERATDPDEVEAREDIRKAFA